MRQSNGSVTKAGNQSVACPLCSEPCKDFYADAKRGWRYHRCTVCELVWMDPDSRPSLTDEHAHYARHENNPEDPRYRDFLNRLWAPLKARLSPGAEGLDYGSGPGPTLHRMAQADGFSCAHYDPAFQPDLSSLNQTYDFITCSETAEHFHDPRLEFERLSSLLKPGGWLGLMTSRITPETDFANWHYRHDPTHVCFYADATLHHIARHFGFDGAHLVTGAVALLRKSEPRQHDQQR